MTAAALRQRSGYFWVGTISLLVAPLAYYRSFVLGHIADDGSVVGAYGVVLILIELVSTFVLFGGGTVVTKYVAQLHDSAAISAFLTRYTSLNIVLLAIAILLVMLIAPLNVWLQKTLAMELGLWNLMLALFVVLGGIALCTLSGLQQFALASLLTNAQMLFVCGVATAMLFVSPAYITQHAITVLLFTVMAAYCTILIASAPVIKKAGIAIRPRGRFPDGFWRYALIIHVNSICNFVYRTSDQLFVLSALGVKALGGYFIAVQLADLVGFLPLRTAQVMLARFSAQIRARELDRLADSYALLVRIVSCIAGVLALTLIYLAEPISGLFGQWAAANAVYLQWLAVICVVGCLNSVNSMIIMASEAMLPYLCVNLVQMGLQLTVTIMLIGEHGVAGVILAKFLGMVVLQAGLIYIIRRRLQVLRLVVSWHYYVAVLAAIFCVGLSQALSDSSFLLQLLACCTSIAIFLLVLRVGARDFRVLLTRG